jgi:uncharacterized membrane protein
MIEFTIPPFNIAHIHKFLVHFPIVMAVFALVFCFLVLVRKDNQIAILLLKYSLVVLFLSSVISVGGGLYSAGALLGKNLTEQAWLSENQDFISMLYFHRSLGFLITVMSFVLVAGFWYLTKKHYKIAVYFAFALLVLINLAIFFNSHIGGNIGI